MKVTLFLFFSLCIAFSARAQSDQYSSDQLDQMLGPIALYPDPLVALILPASTNPSEVTAAAEFVAANGDPSTIDAQPWDPSIKGLAHYPDVLKWMNDNISWTEALGAAFAMQPADVMKSVQQLRAKARAAGSLVNTPQQQVAVEGDDIRIVPTEPNTIFVPQYDPSDVYDVPEGYSGPLITFDAGYPVGPWLGFECDWDDFGIWAGPWHPGWDYRRDWRGGYGGARWRPDAYRGHQLVRNFYRPGGEVPSPHMIAGARIQGPGGSVGFRAAAGERGESHGSVTITHSAPPDYRGYDREPPRPSSPAPSALFGGYSRGSQARDYSNRGFESRQAPVRRSAPASRQAPERSSAPAPRDHPH